VPPPFHPVELLRAREPFDHPDWLFELKHDGFRALAYISVDGVRLVSRRGHAYRQFDELREGLRRELAGHEGVLDGELVVLGPDGRSLFYELRRRQDSAIYVAFDLLQVDGDDLCDLPLIERTRRLRRSVSH